MVMFCKMFICLPLLVLVILVPAREGHAQTASAGGYSLAPSANTVATGSTITVSWQAPSTHGARDWIGLFYASQPSAGNTVITYRYVPSGTSGTVTLQVPNVTQTYQVRYLLNDGYNVAAASSPITARPLSSTPSSGAVSGSTSTSSGSTSTGSTSTTTQTSQSSTPQPVLTTYTLSATPSSYSLGGSITIAWQAPSSHSTRDWIGLFLVGKPSAGNTVIAYRYVPSGSGGTMTFIGPNLQNNQLYEFRYLINDGYTKVATSNPITAVSTASPAPSTSTTGSTTTGSSQSPTTPSTSLPSSSPTPSQTASGSATLVWKPSSSSDVAGYKIYRGTASGAYGAAIATLSRSVTTFQATGLQLNTTYYFVVTAFDGSNNESAYSNEVSKSIY